MDVKNIRKDFPALHQEIYGKPLVYFDNAATTQKPRQVIERMIKYYEEENCNIHRGVHYLSQKATEAFENARRNIQQFINAKETHEIIFTKGTTDSVNLVKTSFGEEFLQAGDEVIVSVAEHHSNFVPWQVLSEKKNIPLRIIPVNDKGELIFEEFEKLLNEKTKLLAITHTSNTLGSIVDIKKFIDKAHEHDVVVLIDGAQAVMHKQLDVQELDCDFYCFSGHKMYAPMGGGILYGKEKLLEKMPPFQYGGEMVDQVTIKGTSFNELPFKFEAGTPNVEAILGLDEAIKYLQNIGFDNIAKYEKRLLDYATEKLLKIEGLRILGTSENKASLISFLIGDIHPYDAGTIIDKMGIAVRTGHHCAQPVLDHFEVPGTIRASMVFYNTFEEIDRLVEAIMQVKKMFE
ncbi:MAG: cysteine desulfurase [Bacteroidales bacterium]|nr:cysteine desulfurase [Bacteroidales bacterium]MCF8344396.1 cysteine desulfurase [Bacteroidales bacterium]MCF8351968.1 cysteine desulfurase [Bacteroidales bacterium]MCF8376382.1 cysteine desulfurase [Bacteroidales bacterium]MCF8401234.1 cysteine desulfurase [Bacteroidales bacterium]